MKTNSLRKQKVLEFIQIDENADFVFELEAKDEQAVDNFIHGMRVELSRLRDLVRARNRTIKHFKMLKDKVELIEAGKYRITLRKTVSNNDVSNEIDEVLDNIAGGPVLNVNS